MPWQDFQVLVSGKAARDVSLNFIQRWNWNRTSSIAKGLSKSVSGVLDFAKGIKAVSDILDFAQIIEKLEVDDVEDENMGTLTCQVIRSVSLWSFGTRLEASILQAYLTMIQNAEYYIYMETQFFISSMANDTEILSPVINKIAETLYERIKLAFERDEHFRVYLILPLYPEGNLGDDNIKALIYWQVETIISLIKKLRNNCYGICTDDYISIFSLYNWGLSNNTYFHEQIYVHSKLIIVDDKQVIIGSQNINDRSLLGDRDSELGVVFLDDEEKVESTMNRGRFTANKFAISLRHRIWKEHLGINENIDDPISDETWHMLWRSQAKINTTTFNTVFPVIPQNYAKSYEKLIERPKGPIKAERLSQIKGHIIFYPLDFLEEHEQRHFLLDELFQ